ncbi:MAG TPA: M20 family metallopeptidase [Synergistaceae bacterium]|nr:M20 family metallopeptidase [Synergistaceae bacterium]
MKTSVHMLETAQNCLEEKALLDLTRKLISIPSHHGLENPEEEISLYLRDFLVHQGLETERRGTPEGRFNVLARYGKRKSSEKTLMLNGHTDTVDVANMIIPPFSGEIKDGKIFGRGSVDMKGSLAAMIHAVLAIKKAGIPLEGEVLFAGVADEEFWNAGTRDLVKRGPRARYAIVGEPTKLQIYHGHRGLEWIEIAVKGKYAHGGTPEKGINAIEKAGLLIRALTEDLLPKIRERGHSITGPSTLNLGQILGGTQPSTVAGECILRLDRRWIPGESTESVLRELEELGEKLHRRDENFRMEVSNMRDMEKNHLGQPPLVTSPDSPLVRVLEETLARMNRTPEKGSFPGWTDAGLLSSAGGMETVVFGPGDISSAHTEKEFCEVDQIIACSRAYVGAILEICS